MNYIKDKDNCLNKYVWGDNCIGWNFVDTDILSIKQELMPPGTAEERHFHNNALQFFFILEGTATFEIEGEVVSFVKNQGIEIRPGQRHLISNRAQNDLEFILCSQPSTKNDRINC